MTRRIDWTAPLELMDGTGVRLITEAETQGVFGGTNPDRDGDYWVINEATGDEFCFHPDGESESARSEFIRNRPCHELPDAREIIRGLLDGDDGAVERARKYLEDE